MIEFFSEVRDQVVNQSPLGLEGGGVYLTPRLEAWSAVCDIMQVPPDDRRALVTSARFLFECIEDRERTGGVHRIPERDLAPISWEDFDARTR